MRSGMTENNKSVFTNLALEFVRVTEAAAISGAKWIGKGDGKAADGAAVDAMRSCFNQIDFCGEVVIGEGAKDEAPELYVGERLGCKSDPMLDIAVDPLECTASVAYGRPNAISVIAAGPAGSLYKAADSYMEKIAVSGKAAEVIDLDAPTKENIAKVARALGKEIGEITVAVLDRPRHEELIKQIRGAGARVQLFTDGDIAMAIATCMRESPVDILMGIGGSTEAVIAAAALKCMDGEMFCRWKPLDFALGKPNEKHIARLRAAGITDFDRIFSVGDLARGDDVTFTATGVISGPLLNGVVFSSEEVITHSVVISSRPKTIRFLKSRHINN